MISLQCLFVLFVGGTRRKLSESHWLYALAFWIQHPDQISEAPAPEFFGYPQESLE